MSDPKISVIIPTYNRSGKLINALNSVLNQTYQQIEIIVVDDNSVDDTELKMKGFCEKVKSIKYIKHHINRGGGAARNTGVSYATGEYIAFLDSDDLWINTKLEEQIKLIISTDISMVFTGFNMIEELTNKIIDKYIVKNLKKPYEKLLFTNYIGTTSTILIKKQVFEDVGGFNINLSSCQDWDLYLKVSKKYKIKGLEKLLVNYYVHQNSITGNYESSIDGHLKVYEQVTNDSMVNARLKKKIMSVHLTRIASIYMRFGKIPEARVYFLKSFKLNPMNKNNIIKLIPNILGIYNFANKFTKVINYKMEK
jgi:glycosyltransferase involved in cell wall biosynthesis